MCQVSRVFFVCLALISSSAADLTLKVADIPPPMELSEGIKRELEPKAIQLLNSDKPVFEFWFRKDIPATAKPESPAKALSSLKEGTLIGVAFVHGSQRDYRDDELTSGAYTMRFGLQPQDGNHLGTAEFPTFVLLSPAKADTKTETVPSYKALVKVSSDGTTTDHPRVLSLRPLSAGVSGLPKLNAPIAEHKTVAILLSGKSADVKVEIPCELVYEGVGHK
jgi:hypothetical protein